MSYPLPAICKKIAWLLGLAFAAICFYFVLKLGMEWHATHEANPIYAEQTNCQTNQLLNDFVGQTLNQLSDAYSCNHFFLFSLIS